MSPEQRLDLAKRLWDWVPHEGQRAFLTLRLEDGAEPGTLVACCGRRWGKTAALAVDAACRVLTEPELAQLIVGPTRDQAEGLFDEVVALLDEARDGETDNPSIGADSRPPVHVEFPHLAGLVVKRSPYPLLRRKDGAIVLMARSAGRTGRNLRGKGTTRRVKRFRVVCDEAAYIPDAAIEEAILPMLATVPGGGQLAMISSPAGRRGAFYKSFVKGENREGRYRSVRLPSSQNPLVDDGFLAEMQAEMTERRFRAEFLAEFVESEGAVFRDAEIDGAVLDDDPEVSPLPGARYVAGVDFGRRGDYTVVVVARVDPWQVSVVDLVRVRGLAWSAQVKQAADALERWGVRRVSVDRTGVGDAIAEQLQNAIIARRLRCALDEFVFTPASKRVLVDRLSLLLSSQRVRYPAYPALIGELRAFEVLAVSVTGSERMAAAEGHDDTVIALGLCCQAANDFLTVTGANRLIGSTGGPRSVGGQSERFVGMAGNKDAEFAISRDTPRQPISREYPRWWSVVRGPWSVRDGEEKRRFPCWIRWGDGGAGYAACRRNLRIMGLRLLLIVGSVYRYGGARRWGAFLRRIMGRRG